MTSADVQVSNITKIWPLVEKLDEFDRHMTKLLATYRKLQTRLKCKSYEALYHAAVSQPRHTLPANSKYSRQHSMKYLRIRYTIIYSEWLTGNTTLKTKDNTSLTINQKLIFAHAMKIYGGLEV